MIETAETVLADDAAERTLERGLAAELALSIDRHFERFVEAYQHRLYGFVLTLVRNANDAEEIAQDAFVSAYKALRGYEAARIKALSLRPWLFTIALNKVRNRSRKRPALSLDDAARDGLLAALDHAESPEEVAEQNDRVRGVWRALDALGTRYRLPVLLRHIEGFSYEEIAGLLDQPVGTAKSNVHRGIELLRASRELSEVKG